MLQKILFLLLALLLPTLTGCVKKTLSQDVTEPAFVLQVNDQTFTATNGTADVTLSNVHAHCVMSEPEAAPSNLSLVLQFLVDVGDVVAKLLWSNN